MPKQQNAFEITLFVRKKFGLCVLRVDRNAREVCEISKLSQTVKAILTNYNQ